jgi:hypothetical protein
MIEIRQLKKQNSLGRSAVNVVGVAAKREDEKRVDHHAEIWLVRQLHAALRRLPGQPDKVIDGARGVKTGIGRHEHQQCVRTDLYGEVQYLKRKSYMDGGSYGTLVTGAASGMGLATAKAFAEAGASVALADWNEEAVRAVTAELVAAGHQAIAIRCDVADEAQVAAMVEQTVAAFGRLDAAFNNAGVQSPIAEPPMPTVRSSTALRRSTCVASGAA